MEKAKEIRTFNSKQMFIWLAALILGGALGMIGSSVINEFFNFIASAYTRLFKFVAVPTIALAVTTTLAMLGAKRDTGRIFLYTIIYTLLTTLAAAVVGAVLYVIIAPGNLSLEVIRQGQSAAAGRDNIAVERKFAGEHEIARPRFLYVQNTVAVRYVCVMVGLPRPAVYRKGFLAFAQTGHTYPVERNGVGCLDFAVALENDRTVPYRARNFAKIAQCPRRAIPAKKVRVRNGGQTIRNGKALILVKFSRRP